MWNTVSLQASLHWKEHAEITLTGKEHFVADWRINCYPSVGLSLPILQITRLSMHIVHVLGCSNKLTWNFYLSIHHAQELPDKSNPSEVDSHVTPIYDYTFIDEVSWAIAEPRNHHSSSYNWLAMARGRSHHSQPVPSWSNTSEFDTAIWTCCDLNNNKMKFHCILMKPSKPTVSPPWRWLNVCLNLLLMDVA